MIQMLELVLQVRVYNKMNRIFILLVLFISHLAWANIMGSVQLKGKVLKYNKNTVLLLQDEQKIEIPRNWIPKTIRLQTGKTVTAIFNVEEMKKYVNTQPHTRGNPED